MDKIGFYHGALAESYEEQANKQGYTFGDKAEWIEIFADCNELRRIMDVGGARDEVSKQ